MKTICSNNWAIAQMLAAMMFIGCSDKQHDCNYLKNCGDAPVGGSYGSGGNGGANSGGAGAANASGTSAGGTFAAGGTGGSATGGIASVCNPVCSGTKPVCNESAKTCVECKADGNCSGATPACNTSTNSCVECTADGNCFGAKPACNTTTNACVRCVKDANCSGSTPFCDTAQNTCIQCRTSADCTLASASACVAGTCTGCSTNTDCTHITGNTVCKLGAETADAGTDAGANTGTCFQCSVEDELPCAGKSCNPTTNTCTNTERGSVDICHACLADSECIGGAPSDGGVESARCVAMTFNGVAHGKYCLLTAIGGCPQPYTIRFSSPSASGIASDQYCGVSQTATTCEAVVDLTSSKVCANDSDCGTGQSDGLCRNLGIIPNPNRCTIPCSLPTQCPEALTCTSPTTPYCH